MPLQELVSAGYLRVDEVGSLRNLDVTVPVANEKTNARDIFIRARLHNGREIDELADGSFQLAVR